VKRAAVIVERVVSYLEMTSSERLVPGREPPTPPLFDPVEGGAPLVRETHVRVGTPHHWSSVHWTDEQWAAVLTIPHQYNWILRVDGEVAGLTSMLAEPGGDVQIMVFGLVPEWVGRGYGGAALTESVRLAWKVPPLGAAHVRRVHLDTMSLDHPHALPNYLARGFRVYRTEHSTKEIPDEVAP
jgi:RimJ/RimL family protein N-acetyltransferase